MDSAKKDGFTFPWYINKAERTDEIKAQMMNKRGHFSFPKKAYFIKLYQKLPLSLMDCAVRPKRSKANSAIIR
jgi:hypothetical protein